MSVQADSVAIQNALRRMLDMRRWDDARLYAAVPDVSGWSPAQHLAHLCDATRLILEAIEALEASTDDGATRPARSPRLAGRAVLVTGRIPRGRAQAPRGTVPAAVPARAALHEALEAMSHRVAAAAARAHGFRRVAGARLHPALGWLGAAQWWRFLRVHDEHHLAIVADIDRHLVQGAPLPLPARPLPDHP